MNGKSSIPITHTNLAIAMLAVASTQIHSIGHDPATNTLAVQFKKKDGAGDPYYYGNVSAEQFYEFKAAESKGTYFGQHFKSAESHPCTKYVPEPKKEAAAA